jgi:Tol biopolymer transport system component/tRNA A-37 threonylcarbamoyl transferase component Bud32
VSLIGAGGMGEVYEARDSRLGRRVAVKVIRADVASDPHRRKRFEREARAVAALSHPNICAVFDVGREETPRGPLDYLVVEYLEGLDLSARLKKGPLPTDELLRAGAEIAAALDSAHRAGIVHRDVKPSNIVLARTGAKLLDFGLARLRTNPGSTDSDGSAVTEAARSDTLTDAGVAVGTYPYMAPELLEGKPVDARADLFALGAVLYEMATGRRAFSGSTPASLAAAILTSEPPALTSLRPVAPPALERLVKSLLAKNPDARIQTAHDVVLRLRDIEQDEGSGAGVVGRRIRTVALWTLAALVGTVALNAAWERLRRPPAVPLPAPRVVRLTTLRNDLYGPTFSPDGQQVAFCWLGDKGDNWDIYVKRVDAPEVLRLTNGPEVDVKPRWSPDGRLIAFAQYPVWGDEGAAKGKIRVISPLGGASRKISDLSPGGTLSWSPDGRWLASRRWRSTGETRPEDGAIYLVPVEGGEARVLTRPASPGDDSDPAFSPDGRRMAYTSCSAGATRPGGLLTCNIFVLELAPGYVPGGPPRQVTRLNLNAGAPAWTSDGASIIYEEAGDRLYRVQASGDRPPEAVELAGLQARAPAVAPTGNRLAFVRFNNDTDIYRFEPGQPPEPVLASSAAETDPDYSPDGRRIAFSSTRGGTPQIWLAEASGANPMQLTQGPGKYQGSPAWSPDGRRIAFDSQAADSHWDIWTVDPEGGAPRQLTHDPGDESVPTWSRDGRWVYFSSTRSGAREAWRVPSAGGVEERVTHGGASFAKEESVDGRSLLYWREKDDVGPILAHPLDGGPERTLVECAIGWGNAFRVLASGIYYRGCGGVEPGKNPMRLLEPAGGTRPLGWMPDDHGARFAVSPDGKSILYSRGTGRSPDLMMIENFQ